MKRATVSLPDDLAELAEHEAQRLGTSVSELYRNALSRYLGVDEASPRRVGFAAIFEDDGLAGERVDDLLAASWADDLERDRR
jgi:Ribbon-helix-helix protein, copG family